MRLQFNTSGKMFDYWLGFAWFIIAGKTTKNMAIIKIKLFFKNNLHKISAIAF